MTFDDLAAGVVTALRLYGAAYPPLVLPAVARAFTLGAADDCDLVIPNGNALGVASVHATIERTDAAVRVRGRGAQALYRCRHQPPVSELLLHAGEVGWIGGCAILAMDERTEVLRARLAWSLGLDAHAEVDRALTSAVDGGPVALVGSRSLDAAELARAIHAAGAGARSFVRVGGDEELRAIMAVVGPPVSLAPLSPATVAIDLDGLNRLLSAQVAALLSPSCPSRVIFLASDERTLRRHLDCYADRLHAITLVPLVRRAHELSRLLQRIWRDELGSALGRRARSTRAARDRGARLARQLRRAARDGGAVAGVRRAPDAARRGVRAGGA